MEKPVRYVQYALVYKADGSPVTLTHQDDEETPLVASTMRGILSLIGRMADMSVDDAIRAFENSDEYTDMEIVREVVTRQPLSGKSKERYEAVKAAIFEEWK